MSKPKFAIGDRVEPLVSHMPGMKAMVGTVKIAREGNPPYYGVKFPEMDKVHKWYAEDELRAAKDDADLEGKSKTAKSHATMGEAQWECASVRARVPSHFHFTAPITLADDRTTWVQILVTGEWQHPRYGKLAITSEKLKELKDNFDAGARDFVYADYDHGIANPRGDGNAIAAGEVKALQLRAGDTELWAEFEPTPPAREKIVNKEYRKTSADFVDGYRDKKTGKNWGAVLQGFALTNRPYIEGMQPLALGDAHGDARLFADYTKESSMKTAEKLGLPADATDEQIGAAIDKLNSDAGKATTLSESLDAATGTIGEVRSVLNLAEDADVVGTVRTLSERVAELQKKDREAAADKLLSDAIAQGKVAPAMKATPNAT